MNTTDDIVKLKARVLKHKRYREMAEATGLSESFLSKFATHAKTNYQTDALQKVASYFSRKRAT
jgi:transcriptional regulator with XRE-family HTH domain